MKLFRTPVALFFLAAGCLFLLSYSFFLTSQPLSFLMEPETYIDTLKRTGGMPDRIPISIWKYFLARDPLCRAAETIIIGSSRVREIDASVIGTSVCNLYVEGLSAPGFARLAENLSSMTPGHHPVVYIGIDHAWLLWVDVDHLNDVDLKLLDGPMMLRPLWKAWAASQRLDYFSIDYLLEAVRRYREGSALSKDQSNSGTWYYPDGHQSYPRYYAAKHSGKHHSYSQQDFEREISSLFGGQRVIESNLHPLETGIRLLHAKGYVVRLFWNPVNPRYIASARQRFPVLFRQIIDAVDQLASTLPLDRYIPASQTLDASRFGCSEHDDFDPMHIDIDCTRRMFANTFGDHLTKARL